MDIALSGRFFAHHNKNSHGQNGYQWAIGPDDTITLDWSIERVLLLGPYFHFSLAKFCFRKCIPELKMKRILPCNFHTLLNVLNKTLNVSYRVRNSETKVLLKLGLPRN